jgi:hypothetical protein
MTLSTARPKWWQLYLIFPLLIVLFLLEHQLKISTYGHQAVQIGIVLIVYGLIYVWLKANSSALAQMDGQQYHGRIMVVQIAPLQLPEADDGKRALFRFSNSEAKGLLSNTFEMETIEAEAFAVDEVSQEIDKE